jgi:ribonuclease P protein component
MSRLSIDRRHSFAGRENLSWFFANRKWVRVANRFVEAGWAKRSQPEGDAAIRFLILASKRSHRRAHDRNQIKRWLRAAIAEVPTFLSIESECQSHGEQVVVMLRTSKPMKELKWEEILKDVERIAVKLAQISSRPSSFPPSAAASPSRSPSSSPS